jgi:hypothetical protein
MIDFMTKPSLNNFQNIGLMVKINFFVMVKYLAITQESTYIMSAGKFCFKCSFERRSWYRKMSLKGGF